MTLNDMLDAEYRDGRLAVTLFIAAAVVGALVVAYSLVQADIAAVRADNARIRDQIAAERVRTDDLLADQTARVNGLVLHVDAMEETP